MPGCGASGDVRSPATDFSSVQAFGRGPLPTGCGCGACGSGDPSGTPQCALLRAGLAHYGGGMRVPGGGRLLPECWASGVGRSPTPDLSSVQACGRGPLPTGCGCGGCGCGDPSPTPQRVLLRAGFAHCGGGMRVPGGGRLLPGCGASGVGRSPIPDHSSFRACGRGPLPTGCGCGGCGRGDPSPTPQRALLRAGSARCGVGMRVPGEGHLLPGCGASGDVRSPAPDHSSVQACGRGPLPTGCGCGACGRGDPSPTPKRALLRAGLAHCGGGMRVPGGGRLLPGCGASGVGRSPTPDLSSVRACGRGPLPTSCGCGGCGRGDPSPTPQRALLRAGFAHCGGGMRVPGGGAPCLDVGRPGSGALPSPTTRPFGPAAGAHYPLAAGAGGAGVGTRHQPHSVRSCELALRAVGAA